MSDKKEKSVKTSFIRLFDDISPPKKNDDGFIICDYPDCQYDCGSVKNTWIKHLNYSHENDFNKIIQEQREIRRAKHQVIDDQLALISDDEDENVQQTRHTTTQVVQIKDKSVLETKLMDLFKAFASKAISDNDYMIALQTLTEQYTEHD